MKSWKVALLSLFALTAQAGSTPARQIVADQIYPSGGTNPGTAIEPIALSLPAGLAFLVSNASSTGTTQGKLAILTSSSPATIKIATTSDTNDVVGLVVGGAGTTGLANLVQIGLGYCLFDGATTAGDYVQESTTSGGECHDAGASAPSAQTIGRVMQTIGSPGSAQVMMSAGGGGSSITLPISTANGGLGANNGSASGVPVFSGGTATITTLGYNVGGTNALTQAGLIANACPLSNKGDIYTFTGSTATPQAVPGDNGELIPDAQQTNGWRSAGYSNLQKGRPGKNYIQYADFENGATTGWTLGTIGTLTNGLPIGSPIFGSGASGNLSLAVESSGQLAGSDSLGYVSSAATTQGNMVASSSYAIDPEDKAKVLTVKFYYSFPSGSSNVNASGTSSNSYAWALWDVTNSAWLTSAGNFCTVQLSGTGYCTGTAQTALTTANVRLVIYNANATAGAATMYLDDFFVGPQTAPMGPAMTDWVAYTPTITGFGTTSNVSFYSRRVGANLEVNGSFESGTSTATQAQITLGYNGGNANVTINGSAVDTTGIVGSAIGGLTSSTFFGAYPIATGSNNYIAIGVQTSAANALAAANGSAIASSTNFIGLHFSVPIVGWSSNSAQSSDTDTRVVAAAMTGAAATVTGSYSDVTWTTIVNDTHGAMGSINYTVPVTGYYNFPGSLYVGATSLSAGGGFLVSLYNTTTSTTLREKQYLFDLNVPENESLDFNWQKIYLTAGTQVKIQVKTTGTVGSPVINSSATLNYLSVGRDSGPAVVAATESVNARYHATGTQSISNGSTTALTNLTTKDWDTHNAFNTGTGVYTAPVSGKYQFALSVPANALVSASGVGQDISCTVSGPTLTSQAIVASSTSSATYYNPIVTDTQYLLAGQTLTLQVYQSLTASALNVGPGIVPMWFSIARVGN